MTSKLKEKYSLEIIHADKDVVYKSHNIDDLDTIGVHENEAFKIRLRNNTSGKIQARVSIDGTDIVTGELAHTRTDGKMWVIQPYDYLELKAWPETDDGGAEFLFGVAKNGVAANTHGNLSAKGLIAVAIFEERYIPAAVEYSTSGNIIEGNLFGFGSRLRSKSVPADETTCRSDVERERSYDSDSLSLKDSYVQDVTKGVQSRRITKSVLPIPGPAVGAGGHVKQAITKGTGLVKPEFAGVVQVKYEWWEALRTKIRTDHKAFPGDKKNIDLKNTPRLNRDNNNRLKNSEYSRF